jgi:hypothetical protein
MSGERAMPLRQELPDPPDALIGATGRYVVGVDGSAASRAALSWAALRILPRHPLQLLGIVEDAIAPPGAGREDAPRWLARVLSDAADELLGAHPNACVTIRVERDPVVDALVLETGAEDLLVVGSDKTGFVRGRTFGVRPLQLAAAMRGALAVVPSVDLRLRTGVAVAVDDLGSAPALALRGGQEAANRSCTLTIVHAVARDSGAQRARSGDAVLAAARGAVLAAHPGLEVRVLAAQRHAAEAILNASREEALLLLGHSLRTTALGVSETVHEVLMNVNAPTVIFH